MTKEDLASRDTESFGLLVFFTSRTLLADSPAVGITSKKQALPSEEVNQTPALATPELAPGMRVVVKEDDAGWKGHSGIIMSKREGEFWVLLDHTVSQGMEVKHLLKPHQIQPEAQQPARKADSQELFTADDVEQKIVEAIAQYNREKAESEQGRFIEIRDAALLAAKQEIQAAQEYSRAIAQKNQHLLEKLAAKDEEMQSRVLTLGIFR